jgi:folate-binding protein YgfZ
MTDNSPPKGRLAHLHSRALIAVHGPDWRDFLHNLLTTDVEGLRPGEMRFGGLLTPQGRLLFDLFLVGGPDGDADGCLIDCDADRCASLVQRLAMYRLRAKVQIEAQPGTVFAAWGDGPPEGAGWYADPRLPALGWRGYGVAPRGEILDEATYQVHRLALGAPDPDGDCPPDKTYPIEANFDLLGGIDFQKGCFVGQETTSRMKRRGPVKNRMLPITFDGPPPPFGAEVLAGSLRAGEVLQAFGGRAMALLRLDRIAGAQLTVDGRSVSVETPAWWPPSEQPA